MALSRFREEILAGRLRPGARLPFTRSTAARYGVESVNILTAFDILKSEGYVKGTVGSGTMVASVLPDEFFKNRRAQLRTGRLSHASSLTLRERPSYREHRPYVCTWCVPSVCSCSGSVSAEYLGQYWRSAGATFGGKAAARMRG